MKFYVASSWRNTKQPAIVEYLRSIGHDVYDFRNPADGDHGFHWSEIDSDWKNWTPDQFKDSLEHPLAESGFGKDMGSLDWCDACVLVLPCGRSAHLEAGYIVGKGKPLYVLLDDGEPELMYKMATKIILDIREIG